MQLRFALGLLAVGLSSCVSQGGFYETEDTDAVPIYRGLIGRFPKLPDCILRAYNREATDPVDLNKALSSYDPYVGEISRAARARRCEWTYDKLPAITQDYPIDYGIDAGKILVVRSHQRFAQGESDGALEDLFVLSRFGSDLAQDRWTIGKLVGAIAIAFAMEELRDLIIRSSLRPEHYDGIELNLASIARRCPSLESMIRDERIMALPLLEELSDVGLEEVIRRVTKEEKKPKDPPFVVDLWESWLRATLKRDLEGAKARIRERWTVRTRPLEEEARKPVNARDLRQQMESLRSSGRELSQRMARNLVTLPFGSQAGLDDIADLLLLLWCPALEKAGKSVANLKLQVLQNLIACRLEQHRSRTGTYPESFATLEDPYTGTPISYRRIVRPDGEGFVLASAGPLEDAETRMRGLADDCRFDRALFENRFGGDADALTMGVFRMRDSLR